MQLKLLDNTIKHNLSLIFQLSLLITLPYLLLTGTYYDMIIVVLLSLAYHSIGYIYTGHYLLGHGLYKNLNSISKFVLFFGFFFVSFIRPQVWGSIHVAHHKFADTEKDPHSPKYLGWKVVLSKYDSSKFDLRTHIKIDRDTVAGLFEKYYYVLLSIPLISMFIVPIDTLLVWWFVPGSIALWMMMIWAYITHRETAIKLPQWVEYIFIGEDHDHKSHHQK